MSHETTPAPASRPLVAAVDGYAIDRHHGFVPADDPADRLPDYYRPWERAARNISALIMTDRLRATVEALPELTVDRLESDAERERAMLVLCCLANAYVWAGDPPVDTLPAPVARPLHRVAHLLDRPPIVAHASTVLNNWRRIDPSEPLSMSNIDTQLTFLGGVDEKWLYLATVGVELAGAPALPLLVRAQHAAAAEDHDRLADALLGIRAALKDTVDALLDMERWCDPHVFYHRIRPFLTGWDSPGLRLEGGTGSRWPSSGRSTSGSPGVTSSTSSVAGRPREGRLRAAESHAAVPAACPVLRPRRVLAATVQGGPGVPGPGCRRGWCRLRDAGVHPRSAGQALSEGLVEAPFPLSRPATSGLLSEPPPHPARSDTATRRHRASPTEARWKGTAADQQNPSLN
ncbi:hypothetical protein [Streptomyces sioyaensis]|uniref:hypothetical protein n=1 Tax=Streptomyces sioyaensis TaxID=67364 RepID=UPI0037B43733